MADKAEMNLIRLVEEFASDDQCRRYLEALRWNGSPKCPGCGRADRISPVRQRHQFDCAACHHRFSVTSGTSMHDTKVPLRKWFITAYLMLESKKAISANQIKRTVGVSYRTAWYLCHRIRKAMESEGDPLNGVVEVDETYIGGRSSGQGGYRKKMAMVVGAKERGGDLRVTSYGRNASPSHGTLGDFVSENIARGSTVYTDDGHGYRKVLLEHSATHESVRHGKQQWVRGDVHTNGIEGAWGLFKRSIIGAYHQVSEKHLPAYLDEFEYRFNNRDNPAIFRDLMQRLLRPGHTTYRRLIDGEE